MNRQPAVQTVSHFREFLRDRSCVSRAGPKEGARLALRGRAPFDFRIVLSALLRIRLAVSLAAQHDSKQTIHYAWVAARAAHGYVRNDAHVALADDLHELHNGVALRAQRLDASPIGLGLCAASSTDGLRFAQRPQPRGLGIAGRLLDTPIPFHLAHPHPLLTTAHCFLHAAHPTLP